MRYILLAALAVFFSSAAYAEAPVYPIGKEITTQGLVCLSEESMAVAFDAFKLDGAEASIKAASARPDCGFFRGKAVVKRLVATGVIEIRDTFYKAHVLEIEGVGTGKRYFGVFPLWDSKST